MPEQDEYVCVFTVLTLNVLSLSIMSQTPLLPLLFYSVWRLKIFGLVTSVNPLNSNPLI